MIAEILAGTVRPTAYVALLYNLLPIYRALEDALEQRAGLPAIAPIARPRLYRSAAIAADLELLSGKDTGGRPMLLGAGLRYVRRLHRVSAEQPERLLAHAYTRHLGDLSGGRILRRILARTPGIGPGALRFFDFDGLEDLRRAQAEYREALDLAGSHLVDQAAVLAEASLAFQLNITLARKVQQMFGSSRPIPAQC